MNNEQPQMQVDLSHTTFNYIFKIRKLSALLSPTGEPTMIPMQVFACTKCDGINSDFLPAED